MSEIRGNFVKESLLDYENLAKTLKENTALAVKDLLGETVRETYKKLLTEDDGEEKEYEVEDTDSENSTETSSVDTEETSSDETQETDDTSVDDSTEETNDETTDTESDIDSTETEDTTEISDESSDQGAEWDEFEDYKVSDGEYNFSNAKDEDVIKVYKLLKDEDQIMVNVDKDSNKLEIKDNQTDTEYLIDLKPMKGTSNSEDFGNDEVDNNLELESNNMNEQKIFELVLNEYNSNVGYTDNYQKKDVMTTPNNDEPSKNTNDWDGGVPKGKTKPFVGNSGDMTPFNKSVNECGDAPLQEEEETVEEATNVGGFVQQNSTSKSHVPTSSGRNARNVSKGGVKVKGTADPRYSNVTNESKEMLAKVNKILKENESLKNYLNKFKVVLSEAAVTNLNLGKIIKLISENTTTVVEKKEIIRRFGEAKTVEQSNALYESISNELKKNPKANLTEDKQFTANGSQKINETEIYKSQDMINSLDLMHRICK